MCAFLFVFQNCLFSLSSKTNLILVAKNLNFLTACLSLLLGFLFSVRLNLHKAQIKYKKNIFIFIHYDLFSQILKKIVIFLGLKTEYQIKIFFFFQIWLLLHFSAKKNKKLKVSLTTTHHPTIYTTIFFVAAIGDYRPKSMLIYSNSYRICF